MHIGQRNKTNNLKQRNNEKRWNECEGFKYLICAEIREGETSMACEQLSFTFKFLTF